MCVCVFMTVRWHVCVYALVDMFACGCVCFRIFVFAYSGVCVCDVLRCVCVGVRLCVGMCALRV